MRLSALELWCKDLDASARFYRDVIGVPVSYSEPHEPENVPHHEAMFGSFDDDTYVFFVLYAAEAEPTTGAHIGLRVDDLDAVHARAVASGVPVEKPPAPSVFGGRGARYRDPDGNHVGVSGD